MSDQVHDHDLDEDAAPADLADLSDHMAGAAAQFVRSVEAVAGAGVPDEAVSILLLELSSLLAAGAPLGAIEDVVPDERFEPDAGAEPDVDRLRNTLHELLGPVDDYVEVFDPYAGPEVMAARLSDDLSQITSDLLHGLAHHAAGRPLEALWWWQFSYLSTWGPAASAALRALQSLVAHVRLEVPIDADVDADAAL
ncbi:DUF5063 domain-containing protein [Longivirga aurantiaca]|uniref:DUF5063 domain-containing protein n=1 Tax=Longivirga aurantiaca TaxID=1837743 RepID=A0ABW1T3H9_9ACTN